MFGFSLEACKSTFEPNVTIEFILDKRTFRPKRTLICPVSQCSFFSNQRFLASTKIEFGSFLISVAEMGMLRETSVFTRNDDIRNEYI